MWRPKCSLLFYNFFMVPALNDQSKALDSKSIDRIETASQSAKNQTNRSILGSFSSIPFTLYKVNLLQNQTKQIKFLRSFSSIPFTITSSLLFQKMKNMAQSFLSNIAAQVLKKLVSLAFQEVSRAWGVESELRKLEDTLSNIKYVLFDAEEKQATNPALSTWLEQLKDVFYDIEDVLDEFECKGLRRQVVRTSSNTIKVRRFFSSPNSLAYRFYMGHKIKEIRDRLDEIAADKTKFHLTERVDSRRVMRMEREMTHSFVRASAVIGRDDDKEKIIKLLRRRGDGGSINISVIPIVGLGGLGKTTLAKLVYNDERVVQHFELKMWECVSDMGPDQLQTLLRVNLEGRKFLLVLDDVRNVRNEDCSKWNELRDLLMEGANGSKIIVTTRSPLVASIVGTVPAHNLDCLSHEDSFSLFKKWAFAEGQDNQFPNLLRIGNEIVTKCVGNPLAVRTLGSLLYSNTDERDWLFVRDNEIWELEHKENDILPALRLSYDAMPSHLKPCFVYCSIFPKDMGYNSSYLIRFWMAHGLIQSSNENEELEDIGMRYFKELWSRSFFQDVVDYGSYFKCKMHDLIHDLGLSILQRELSTVNFHTPSTFENVRHLSFFDTDLPGQEVPAFMNKLNSVRTIRFQYAGVGPTSRTFVDTCISKFQYLRVLDLHDSSFEVLPSSIGTLKHLRYLELARNRRIKKLPDSICKLQNLQYLGLLDCDEFEELPRNIGNMINLRSLYITTKQKCRPENGIGCLNSLRYLSFYRCHNLKYLFEGKQCLTTLRILRIKSCTSLISLSLSSVKYLPALETLIIRNCEKLNLMEEEGNQDLEGLSLRVLKISKLPQLVVLPRWLQGSTNTLQYLDISYCPNFTSFPEWLPNCNSLQKLMITGCPDLLCLAEETHCLTALRELHVEGCPTLSKRCQKETGEDWPKIAHVPNIYLDGSMITPAV